MLALALTQTHSSAPMELPCLESDWRLPCLADICEQRKRIKPSQTFFHRPVEVTDRPPVPSSSELVVLSLTLPA
eukprot:1320838-Prymnesium_polylepis.1